MEKNLYSKLKSDIGKNQMLDLSKEELLQVYDYFANELYTYFERNLNPRLRSSFDCELKEDKKRQSLILSYIDNFREVLENK